MFESEAEYQQRAGRKALENQSGTRKKLLESEQEFKERAETKIYRNAGIKRKMFESQEEYENRAKKELSLRISKK
ncbi:hypothetical protein BRYFOR_07719 [Marvinbryantia formatexigens DSM 14469]|uniref:Uncharacterized protein n=1 Tax=Marvinbryantia formatexigens DSM 14469 TaxID=478749 RepID=C6LGF9_9FIRM|nr:hypothetical protein [Marvinbryantia formatexigens]EET60159.1 hypothetical protein BRYFOR_07719 [Marvinbryantia formatexigens DSM 14469]UWO24192.1 hypothetical protein NQ534_17460 [Marvinbryantia formatexigens DSM 14469]SDF60297.1 hypothetical protein SAMN05660368_01018 [Marvinbryantia formatexigens]